MGKFALRNTGKKKIKRERERGKKGRDRERKKEKNRKKERERDSVRGAWEGLTPEPLAHPHKSLQGRLSTVSFLGVNIRAATVYIYIYCMSRKS